MSINENSLPKYTTISNQNPTEYNNNDVELESQLPATSNSHINLNNINDDEDDEDDDDGRKVTCPDCKRFNKKFKNEKESRKCAWRFTGVLFFIMVIVFFFFIGYQAGKS